MDEQLKRELQEALYGALAAIYENSGGKSEKTQQETNIEIVVSGDSLSLIKAISENDSLDDRITKVASAFEVLNNRLRDFEHLDVAGPGGSFTQFVNFISLLASIPNLDNLKKYSGATASKVSRFLRTLSQGIADTDVSNITDGVKAMMLVQTLAENEWLGKLEAFNSSSAKNAVEGIVDTISYIVETLNSLDVKSTLRAMPDIASIVDFINTFTDPQWIDKLEKATDKLNKRANREAIKNFLVAVAGIFDDPKIKDVFFKDPKETIDGQGIYGLIGLLNWFTQDKFFSKIMKANLAVRLGGASAIKKFFNEVGSIFLSDYVTSMTKEKTDAMQQIFKMLDMVSSFGFLVKISIAEEVLSYNVGKNIARFFNGFVENLTKIELRDFKKAIDVLDSTNELISTLTKSFLAIAAVSLLIAYTRPITTILTIGAIVGMEIILIKSILSSLKDFNSKNAIESMKAFDALIKSITMSMLSVVVAAVAIKVIGEKPIIEALALFAVVTVALLGTAWLLSKSDKLIKQGKEGAEGLAILVGAIGITMVLVALTGIIAKSIDVDNLIWVGVIALAVIGISVLIASFWKHQGKDSMMGLVGLAALVIGLGLNLMLIAATARMLGEVKASDWEILKGIVLAEVVLFGAIGLASKTELIGTQAIKGVVELIALMTGLSLNLMLLTATALLLKQVSAKELEKLAALIAGELAVAGILIGAANSKILDGPGVKTKLAILEILLLGLSVNALLASEAARNVKGVTGDDLWKLTGILGIEIVILGILAGIGYAVGTVSWSIGILEVLLAGLLGISWLTIQVAKAARSVTIEDVEHVGNILGKLGWIATVFAGLSTVFSLASGFIAIGELVIGGMILIVSKAISLIDKSVEAIKRYKESGINMSVDGKSLIEDMGGFISAMAKTFGNPILNVWYAAVAATMTAALMPMLLSVSTFIDVVSKVAKMSIIVGYDEHGKPIYERVEPTVFGEAATKVGEGFKTFIDKMSESFTVANVTSMILMALIGDTLSPIMSSVGSYVDAVLKLATSTYVSGYDENGKAIYEHTDPAMFGTAAEVISANFKTFLETLIKEANNLSFWSDGSIEAIGKSMKPAMEGVSAFADAILKLATGQYITGYDSNGKPEYERASKEDYEKAAEVLTKNFSTFLESLVDEANELSYWSDDSIEAIGGSIKPVMEGISAFVDSILKVAGGTYIKEYDMNGNPVMAKITSDMFSVAARQVIGWFRPFMISLVAESNKLKDDQQRSLKALSESIEPLMKGVSSFTDSILKLATGTYIKGYDNNGKPIYEHITSDDYDKAAKTLTSSMSTFMSTLTKALQGELSEKASKVMSQLTKGGLKDMMDALAKFTKILSSNQFAIIGYDKDGKPIYEMKDGKPVLMSSYYKSIAENIATAFGTFVTTLDSQLKGKDELVKSVSATVKNIKSVFDPLNKFVNSMKTYSEAIKNLQDSGIGLSITQLAEQAGTDINTFLVGLYGEDGTKLEVWSSKVATIDAARQAVDKAVATVLLLKKLVGLNIDEVNENIDKFHTALDKLLRTDFATKTDLFSESVNRFKTIMEDLKGTTYGLTSISFLIEESVKQYLNGTNVTVSNIVTSLARLDLKLKGTKNQVAIFRNEFIETVDKIEAKLKKNEGERNRMLKDLTSHLDNIGKKLKTISSGLQEINSSSMDKVEELARVFAEMQQQQIQMMVEYVNANKPEGTIEQPVQQPVQTNNNIGINSQDSGYDNYFGPAFQFEIKDATHGALRGIMRRMT